MLKRFAILFFMISFANEMLLIAQSREKESNLKAAFIYNFTRYIDWGQDVPDEFTIGIIGTSQVYDALQEIARTKTVNDKKIVVRHFNNPDEITHCNILFISANSSFSLSSVLAKVDKGTLTVSEETGFADMGSAINFVVINDKLKFEANVKSIINEGLKASSQLLKLAIIVD